MFHENLKPSNCFLKINNSESEKNTLQIVVSDPYLDYYMNEPLVDSEAIGNMMHQLICGRLPIQIPDYKRQFHMSVKNSSYYSLIQYYFNLSDGLVSPSILPTTFKAAQESTVPSYFKVSNRAIQTSATESKMQICMKSLELHELIFPFKDQLEKFEY